MQELHVINKYLYELFPDLNFDKLVRNSSNAPTTSTKTPLTKEELFNSRIWIGDNVELRDKVIAKLEEIGIPFDKYSGNAVADESIDINIFSNDFVVYKESKEEFDKSEYYTYGIYRIKIEKSDDENINRLFRFNNLNYYTHINITDAKKFGLKISIIEDDQANSLIYSRDKCLRADQIF